MNTTTETKTIISSLFESSLEVNQKFWNTVRDLMVRPEVVVTSYFKNKQGSQYANPFRLSFLILSIYIVITTWAGFDLAAALTEENPKSSPLLFDAANVIHNSSAFLYYLSLIPVAWLMSKLFSTSNHSSSDCYIIALYILAQTTLLMTLIGIPIAYTLSSTNVFSALSIFLLPYIYFFYKRVFGTSIISTIWKTVLISVVSGLTQFIFLLVFIFIGGVYAGIVDAHQ